MKPIFNKKYRCRELLLIAVFFILKSKNLKVYMFKSTIIWIYYFRKLSFPSRFLKPYKKSGIININPGDSINQKDQAHGQ